jgi:hypothetical protein
MIKNIDMLVINIRQVREGWEKMGSKSKDNEGNGRISVEYQTIHIVKTQFVAENLYRTKVYLVIVDSLMSGFTLCFESLREICSFLGILCTFVKLADGKVEVSA